MEDKLVIALPKGRILDECMPLVRAAGIEPEAEFDNPKTRLLRFATNHPHIDIIRVRSFDVATFVAFGAAHLGIGACRLSVAEPVDLAEGDDPRRWSHIRIATKYPETTKRFFAERGVQAECVKLNGAMELAPSLGLCSRIVDLVSTGSTMKANGLKEVEVIAQVTSRLIVNRAALKTRPAELTGWIDRFRAAVEVVNAAA